jgi:hypothetical protein
MKPLTSAVSVLFCAFHYVSSSYDALVDLLESIEHFLNHLDIETKISPTEAMVEITVKTMLSFLSTLALVTKQNKAKATE